MRIPLPKGLKLPSGLKLPALRLKGRTQPGGKSERVVLLDLSGPGFSATVVELAGRSFSVQECHRQAPPAEGEQALGPVQWLYQRGHVDLPLFVLLPPELAPLHRTVLPRQAPAERRAALQRVARQGAKLQGEVLFGHRKLGKGPDPGTSSLAVLAVGRDGVLAEILDNPDLTLRAVFSSEQALLATLPADVDGGLLALDGPADAPELLHVQNGAVTERRVLDVSVEGGLHAALAATLTALASDASPPRTLLFSPCLGLDAAARAGLAGALKVASMDQSLCAGLPGWDSGDVQAAFTTPGLASLGALAHLTRGAALVSVGFGPERKLPPPKVLAGVGVGLVLALSLLLMGGDEPVKLKKSKQPGGEPVAQAKTEAKPDGAAPTSGKEAVLASDTGAGKAKTTGSATVSPRLSPAAARAKARRMPASLALAAACNRVPDGVRLTGVTAERQGGLVIEGAVHAPSRLAGLQALAAYRVQLLELPFLDSMVDSIGYRELPDGGEELGFVLNALWKEPAR